MLSCDVVTGTLLLLKSDIITCSGYSTVSVTQIKPHPGLAKLYKDSQPEILTFDTTLLPSLCPPRPWSSVYKGGYLISKAEIIRVPYNAVSFRVDRAHHLTRLYRAV